MKLIYGPRRSGKTYQLLKLVEERGGIIICPSQTRADDLFYRAKDMGFDIARPISMSQLDKLHGHPYKELFIDDADFILKYLMFGRTSTPIHTVTMSTSDDAPEGAATTTIEVGLPPKPRRKPKVRLKAEDRRVEL
jgi:hypothetical protein